MLSHTRDGTKNGQIGCLAGGVLADSRETGYSDVLLVCATILRICPSLDNASPSAGHTIFKQSVVSDQTQCPQWPLDGNKKVVAKLCWTSSSVRQGEHSGSKINIVSSFFYSGMRHKKMPAVPRYNTRLQPRRHKTGCSV